MRLTIEDRTGLYKPGLLIWKENPSRIHTAVLVCRKQTIRVDLTVKKLSHKLRVYSTSSTCEMSRTMPGDLGKCSSYIRYEVRDNKISCNIYETKTISGDLISEKKTNNNKKGLT